MGECGLRGGYSEFINFDPSVKAMFLKMISAKLCPTTLGQVNFMLWQLQCHLHYILYSKRSIKENLLKMKWGRWVIFLINVFLIQGNKMTAKLLQYSFFIPRYLQR